MKRHTTRLGQIRAAALFSLALTGCHPAMSTSAPQDSSVPPSSASADGSYTQTVADWPLRFTAHNFGVHCFDTQSCEVLYKGFPHGSKEEPSPSVASYGRPLDKLLSAGRGPILNFPPPAVVNWRSKDGTPHRAEIDMAGIFKDRLIRHNLARDDIPETAGIPDPDIILEVNDRTINVYMRARLSTKALQIPGNRYSDYRNDLVQVFSRTY